MVKPAKGTTTLAFIFKEGVMVAADSRASMGGYICMLFLFFLFSYLAYNYIWVLEADFVHINFFVETRLLVDDHAYVRIYTQTRSQLAWYYKLSLLVNWNSMYEFLFKITD